MRLKLTRAFWIQENALAFTITCASYERTSYLPDSGAVITRIDALDGYICCVQYPIWMT